MCNYNFLGIFYGRPFLAACFCYCPPIVPGMNIRFLITCAGPAVHVPHTWAGHGSLQIIPTLLQSFLTFC